MATSLNGPNSALLKQAFGKAPESLYNTPFPRGTTRLGGIGEAMRNPAVGVGVSVAAMAAAGIALNNLTKNSGGSSRVEGSPPFQGGQVVGAMYVVTCSWITDRWAVNGAGQKYGPIIQTITEQFSFFEVGPITGRINITNVAVGSSQVLWTGTPNRILAGGILWEYRGGTVSVVRVDGTSLQNDVAQGGNPRGQIQKQPIALPPWGDYAEPPPKLELGLNLGPVQADQPDPIYEDDPETRADEDGERRPPYASPTNLPFADIAPSASPFSAPSLSPTPETQQAIDEMTETQTQTQTQTWNADTYESPNSSDPDGIQGLKEDSDPRPLPWEVLIPLAAPLALAPVTTPTTTTTTTTGETNPNVSGSCCTPILNNQTRTDDALKGLSDQLANLGQAIDLALLQQIWEKVQKIDTWTRKFSQSLRLDRVLNLLNTALLLHNAMMLSRNLGESLSLFINNIFSIFGLEDEDGSPININQIIGGTIESVIVSIIGQDSYQGLKREWKFYNTILSSPANIKNSIENALHGLAEGMNTIGEMSGKLGNAMKKSGLLIESSLDWFSETFSFKTGRVGTLGRIIDELETANEVVENLVEVSENALEVTEEVSNITQEINVMRAAIEQKREEKTTEEANKKEASQSPSIDQSDLKKPSED